MDIHDVSEYISWPIPRPEFYIQDILPKQGSMLLYGEPKVKKSWLAQYLAYCISVGEPCVGFRTTQARVFLGNFEISVNAYAWRLKDMARNFTLQERMLYEGTQVLTQLEQTEQFNSFRALMRVLMPKVIVLDCLAMCFGGDENNGEQMGQFIGNMAILKEELGCSLIIVHHTNKNQLASSSVDRARGHSRLTGWVDTLVYMAPQPSGVQLQIKARQATRELGNVNIEFHDYLWSVRGAADATVTQTPAVVVE